MDIASSPLLWRGRGVPNVGPSGGATGLTAQQRGGARPEAHPGRQRPRTAHTTPPRLRETLWQLQVPQPGRTLVLERARGSEPPFASNSFSNPRHTRMSSSHRPLQAPGPGTHCLRPACPSAAAPPNLRAVGQKQRPVGSRQRSGTCSSAGSPARDAPGPREARGTCPQRLRSLEVAQLGRSRRWVLTWGRGGRRERARPRRRGAGRPALGRLPRRRLPSARRAAPCGSVRDRGRRVRVPPAGPGSGGARSWRRCRCCF